MAVGRGLGVAVACALVLAPAGGGVPGRTAAPRLAVFFLQGEQVVSVERPGSSVAQAVTALLAGPTSAEAKRGLRTYVPAGSSLRSATVAGGVATVDLGEKFAAGRNGESLDARLTQLVYTVDSMPGVKSVRVLVSGGVPLGLFPGHSLLKPVTIKSLGPSVPLPPSQPDEGPVSDATRRLQQQLADLGFLAPSGIDGEAGEQTRAAVIAFQKWARLSRDGVAGPATTAALAQAQRPRPVTSGSGRRIEVLLDRQLALVIDGGVVVRTLHVSTGAAGTATPAGSFSVFRKEQRSWSYPFQVWLPWASYFVGGVAFHEYPDVPVVPASHGCVRVPRFDAQFLYAFAAIGTPVRVVARS